MTTSFLFAQSMKPLESTAHEHNLMSTFDYIYYCDVFSVCTRKFHEGFDLIGGENDLARVTVAGTLDHYGTIAKNLDNKGAKVYIESGGVIYKYLHLYHDGLEPEFDSCVEAGGYCPAPFYLEAGQALGTLYDECSCGPTHLHYEVKQVKQNKRDNPRPTVEPFPDTEKPVIEEIRACADDESVSGALTNPWQQCVMLEDYYCPSVGDKLDFIARIYDTHLPASSSRKHHVAPRKIEWEVCRSRPFLPICGQNFFTTVDFTWGIDDTWTGGPKAAVTIYSIRPPLVSSYNEGSANPTATDVFWYILTNVDDKGEPDASWFYQFADENWLSNRYSLWVRAHDFAGNYSEKSVLLCRGPTRFLVVQDCPEDGGTTPAVCPTVTRGPVIPDSTSPYPDVFIPVGEGIIDEPSDLLPYGEGSTLGFQQLPIRVCMTLAGNQNLDDDPSIAVELRRWRYTPLWTVEPGPQLAYGGWGFGGGTGTASPITRGAFAASELTSRDGSAIDSDVWKIGEERCATLFVWPGTLGLGPVVGEGFIPWQESMSALFGWAVSRADIFQPPMLRATVSTDEMPAGDFPSIAHDPQRAERPIATVVFEARSALSAAAAQ